MCMRVSEGVCVSASEGRRREGWDVDVYTRTMYEVFYVNIHV